MKHTWKVTLIMLAIFFAAQLIGLSIINAYVDHQAMGQSGNVTWTSLPYDMERPVMEENISFLYILGAIIIGTILILVLIRFKKQRMWKWWFFASVFITLTIALKPLIGMVIPPFMLGSFNGIDALSVAVAVGLAWFKIQKPNVYIHNFTELFIYGGIAAIFVPILNLFSGIMLLIFISAYDIYAVWHSKHMVKMAKFQTKSGLFAGLSIGYKLTKGKEKKGPVASSKHASSKSAKIYAKPHKGVTNTAVLGGGDIAFPLLFSGVVLKKLMLLYPLWQGFLYALIVPFFATLALGFLLYFAQKGKFYPAMPYLSVGCLMGLFVTWMVAF